MTGQQFRKIFPLFGNILWFSTPAAEAFRAGREANTVSIRLRGNLSEGIVPLCSVVPPSPFLPFLFLWLSYEANYFLHTNFLKTSLKANCSSLIITNPVFLIFSAVSLVTLNSNNVYTSGLCSFSHRTKPSRLWGFLMQLKVICCVQPCLICIYSGNPL